MSASFDPPMIAAMVVWAIGGPIMLSKKATKLDRRRARGRMPELYPDLYGADLEQIFSDDEATRLLTAKLVTVVPFTGADDRARAIGRGASEILRRDLMRVPGLSVASPEDSAAEALDDPARAVPRTRERSVVGGSCRVLEGGAIELSPWLAGTDGARRTASPVAHTSPVALLAGLLESVVAVLDIGAGPPPPETLGRPRTLDGLARLGELGELTDRSQARQRGRQDLLLEAEVVKLLAEEPDLGVAGRHLGRNRIADLLRLRERDPEDPQLCFEIFARLDRGSGGERQAFQFVRRTLELCPTHGKANVLAPRAAATSKAMGHHSELGWRLLPTSAFAATSHASWLVRHTGDQAKAGEIARSTIERWPSNPWAYLVLMDTCEKLGDLGRAAEAGRALLRWLSPEIHPSTWSYLMQDSAAAARLGRGEDQLAAEVERRIESLEEQAARGAPGG